VDVGDSKGQSGCAALGEGLFLHVTPKPLFEVLYFEIVVFRDCDIPDY
jgi:hypothetical protein